ncbi:molybdenum cofactor biosynthesis protein MoaE [Brevibacterium sp. 91QC2O2]|uniref:molybdenum cofactor biosynthesis protein MoaE n=1 Tax=Brevibacterium sp. 91QC2O2 TaxID=2968458 RepID=UPI00211C2753|nr:molybdenum cofactor biosynthesis protein MoaE [Brevibacterium sp. 91QC2O2]MCQ9368788.1 molybdenum cofactor biosynthesis protein MoaE [Brevibacterium sp. 91QC2O2]
MTDVTLDPQPRATVIVASTSAAHGRAQDRSGPVLVDWLAQAGFAVTGPLVVADGAPVGHLLGERLSAPAGARPDLILTSGGTGATPDDLTPEQTARYIDRELPGIVHALLAGGRESTPLAALSRGRAGIAGSTVLINLPGSLGAARDAIAVLSPLLGHLLAQVRDIRTHTPEAPAEAAPSAGDPAESAAGAATPDATGAPGTAEAAGTAEAVPAVVTGLSELPLDPASARRAVSRAGAGATVDFVGTVRNTDSGRSDVTGLEYSAHPDAAAIMQRTVARIAADFPEARIHCTHRTGRLAVGDDAIVVAVSAPHRGEAFACCAAVVDAVKATVPIWKRQSYATGEHTWVGIDGH